MGRSRKKTTSYSAILHDSMQFYDYLHERNITIDGVERDAFRQNYEDWCQSNQIKIPFSKVKHVLVQEGYVYFDDEDKVHIHHDQEMYGEIEHMPRISSHDRNLQPKFVVDQHLSQRIPPSSKAASQSAGDADLKSQVGDIIHIQADGKSFCRICKQTFQDEAQRQEHLKSPFHDLMMKIIHMNQIVSQTSQMKHHVRVDCDVEQNSSTGYYTLIVPEGVTHTITFTILNHSEAKIYILTSWDISLAPHRELIPLSVHQITLKPGNSAKVQFKSSPTQIGELYTRVQFDFQDFDSSETFRIHSNIHISCINDLVKDLTQGRAPVNRRYTQKPKHEPLALHIVDGVKLAVDSTYELEKELGLKKYSLPFKLRSFINRSFKDPRSKLDEETLESMLAVRQILEDGVQFATYANRFSTLLFCEEAQMDVDIRGYDMFGVTMKKRPGSGLLWLEVPGLAENRPSVLPGDQLFVRRLDSKDELENEEYQGFVHTVDQTHLGLGFGKRLNETFVQGMRFRVRFVNNRLPLRLQHRAIELIEEHDMEDLLFPSYDTVGIMGTLHDLNTKLTFYARNPEPNEEQARAIRHIVAGTSRSAPYIVFGPPGTGKTFTIVEAMKQIIKCLPDSFVLACAPSNSAADNMAERLKDHLDVSKLYRMNAIGRVPSAIPEKIKDICNLDRNGRYEFPSKHILMKKRIIICTLITAGRLASACFAAGHFTHVFIDEASQACEPEAVVAIGNILGKNFDKGGQLVLAGDPKQLGAILRSPLARYYHLDISLLERLMTTCEPCKRREKPEDGEFYDYRVITKLVKNYRSHQDILQPPNELFYEGELETCADKVLSSCMVGWDELPNKTIPILFHAVKGEDMQEPNSPSFYNPQEISILMKYIDNLVGHRSPSGSLIKKENVGIITPYRKQVQKIREQLRKRKMDEVKVGSVEEFQGQERMIIFISTVRSQPKFLSADFRFALGFLTNPKRFNVAMTRAKALLVIIGNPLILAIDPCWNYVIEYCKARGCVRGKELLLEINDETLKKLATTFHSLQIKECSEDVEISAHNNEEIIRKDQ